jgi:uncharacterized protein YbjQ (UPF0145 family)
MTERNADDVAASLKSLAERAAKKGVDAVVCVVVPSGGRLTEVWSFGESVEEGAAVDRLLDEAKKIIRSRE